MEPFLLMFVDRGAKLGMLAPMLVHLEREIDREIALESNGNEANEIDEDSEDEPGFIGPMPQVITNDLKSLDEMVSLSFLIYILTKIYVKSDVIRGTTILENMERRQKKLGNFNLK